MNNPGSWSGHRAFVVDQKVTESETVTSFYLKPEDGGPIADYEPGQYIGFELDVPGKADPVKRSYTISEAPGRLDGYRVSIKREPAPAGRPDLDPGVGSNYFHDHVEVGSVLRVRAPGGVFHLDRDKDTPVVLLSGGVGLTPMISMLNSIVDSANGRPVWFIHAVRNRREQAFGAHVRAMAAAHDNINVHIRYDAPTDDDQLGRDHDGEGFLSAELINELTGGVSGDVYLCGPTPFMQALYDGLKGIGVERQRIHYEFFGEGSSLEPVEAAPAATGGPHKVTFKRTGVTATWTPDSGTLLDLAEAAGVSPDFVCRAGACQTCEITLLEGRTEYIGDDVFPPDADDQVLICSARPTSDIVLDA